jgi:hypothetical protein
VLRRDARSLGVVDAVLCEKPLHRAPRVAKQRSRTGDVAAAGHERLHENRALGCA